MSASHRRTIGRALVVLLSAIGLFHGALAQDTVPVRIAYPSGMNGQIPVVADRAGLADRNGLAASYNFFQNGPPMMEALASGNVDVVVSSYQPLTTYLLQQPGTVSIIANLGHSSYALMVDKESPARSLAELKGKRIALSFGSDSHLDLLRAIRALGLDPATDFTLVNLQPNDLLLVLSQRLAEAIVIRQPQVDRLQEQQDARVLQSWPHHYLVVARTDYLERHPSAGTRLQATLRDTVAYIANNGERASVWFGEQLRLDPRFVRQLATRNPIFEGVTDAGDAHIEFDAIHRQRFNDWLEAAFDNGLIKARVKPYTD
ncbi:MAG: NrtA/SsuA/CpmA family ABC transporter substrate-binding protein [Porticoccaceae bacterium]